MKIFKLLPNDPKLNNINLAQWLWCHAMISEDKKENFELLRDVAEHNAMFWNPEGVQQIRDAREKTYHTDYKEFKTMIKDMFGRDLDLTDQKLPQTMPEESGSRKLNINTDQYLDNDLDEVRFTPF